MMPYARAIPVQSSPRVALDRFVTSPSRKENMPKFDYDLFVIGGGSGGVRSARLAAGLGVRTAIAEEYRFGGTCVIRGCVPKKLFVYASEFGHAIDDARAYGWTVGEKRFDWKTLVANKDRGNRPAQQALQQRRRGGGRDRHSEPRRGGGPAHDQNRQRRPQRHRRAHSGRDGRTSVRPRDSRQGTRHHIQRSVPPRGIAKEDRDCRRGLHRNRVCRHFPRPRRGGRTPLSRRRNPSRFRSRSSRASDGNHAGAGRRHHLQHRAGRYRENARGLIGGHEP